MICRENIFITIVFREVATNSSFIGVDKCAFRTIVFPVGNLLVIPIDELYYSREIK